MGFVVVLPGPLRPRRHFRVAAPAGAPRALGGDDGGDGAVGKRLDFLVQEMNRETTTALSKSPGLDAEGLEMTRVGLEMKAEIERLREQVQNVE